MENTVSAQTAKAGQAVKAAQAVQAIQTVQQTGWKKNLHLIARVVYHIALAVYVISQFARAAYIVPFDAEAIYGAVLTAQQVIRFVLIALCLESFLRSPKKALLTAVLLAASALASGGLEGYNLLFDFMAFLLLSDLSNEDAALKILLLVHVGLLLVMIRMTGLGYEVYTQKLMHSLGTGNANTGAAMLFSILILMYAVGLKKHPVWNCLIFWAAAFLTWRLTLSATVVVLMAAFPLGALLTEKFGKGKASGVLNVSAALPLLFAVFSALMTLWFMSQKEMTLWSGPLKSFSQRFTWAAAYAKENGFSLLGVKNGASTDNLYMSTLLENGFLGFGLLLGAFTWMSVRLLKVRRYDLLAVHIIMLIYALSENVPMAMLFNFLPMVFLSAKAAAGETVREAEETGERGEREEQGEQGVRRARRARGTRGTREESLIAAENGKAGRGLAWKIGLTALLVLVTAAMAIFMPEIRIARISKMAKSYSATGVSEMDYYNMAVKQSYRRKVATPFYGIQVQMATYMTHPEGEVTFYLQDKETGEMLEEVVLDAAQIRDNEFLTVLFSKPYGIGDYFFGFKDVSLEDGVFTVWENKNNPYGSGHVYEYGKKTRRDWIFKIVKDAWPARLTRVVVEVLTGLVLIALVWFFPWRRKRARG